MGAYCLPLRLPNYMALIGLLQSLPIKNVEIFCVLSILATSNYQMNGAQIWTIGLSEAGKGCLKPISHP